MQAMIDVLIMSYVDASRKQIVLTTVRVVKNVARSNLVNSYYCFDLYFYTVIVHHHRL